MVKSPPLLCVCSPLCASFKMLAITFRAHLDNPEWSHLKILNLITPAKTLFLSKVTFTGFRCEDIDISRVGYPYSKQSVSLKSYIKSCYCSVPKLCLTLQPHGLQHARLPCPSLSTGAWSNSYPLSQWCHPIISTSVTSFSSCLQSFPASGSFPVSQRFTWGGQSIGASASVLPMNI